MIETTDRLRIMQIIAFREFRGAEIVARDLCEQLIDRGHEVCLVSLFEPPDLAAAEQLTARIANTVDLGGTKRPGTNLAIARSLYKAIRQFRPDVVQANAFSALKFAALVKLATRADYPIVYRNVGIASRWVNRFGQRSWGKFLLRQVDQVVSVSEQSRNDFYQTYGFPLSRIRVTRQGVQIPAVLDHHSDRRRLLDVLEVAETSRLLIHVGKFSSEKNHTGLLRAFASIHRQVPSSCLALIGDGPLRQEMEAEVRNLKLDDSVRFLGARVDAAKLAAGADLMLVSSHVEGIPGVVLEACAHALPVVSTDVGGMGEIVRAGETGKLVTAGDMESLAKAAVDLLKDDDERQRFGQAGRRFVQQHHDLELSVDELESIYRDLLPGRSGSRGSLVRSAASL